MLAAATTAAAVGTLALGVAAVAAPPGGKAENWAKAGVATVAHPAMSVSVKKQGFMEAPAINAHEPDVGSHQARLFGRERNVLTLYRHPARGGRDRIHDRTGLCQPAFV